MIKSVVTKIGELDPNLGQKFHSVFVVFARKRTRIWADEIIYADFEVFKGRGVLDITMQTIPLNNAIGEVAIVDTSKGQDPCLPFV